MTPDLFTRLREADPASDIHGYDDARLTRLANNIISDSSREAIDSATSRRVNRRRLVIALPVAAALAAALVIAPSLTGSPGVSAEAATLLNKAADSITTADPVARPAQWWKITTTGFNVAINVTATTNPSAWVTVLEGRTDTQYVAVDGSLPTFMVHGPARLVRQLTGDPVGPSFIANQPNQKAEVSTSNLSPNLIPGTWQTPNAAFLKALSRDTETLRKRLYDDTSGHGRSRDGEVFVYVADVLRSGLVPADLRAALYRVLATVPGIEVTTRRASIGSVSGVAFGRNESPDGTRQEIVIDPTTGDLIGERELTLTAANGIAAGTVTGESAATRTLVDVVPASVVASAKVYTCSVTSDGAVQCAG